MLIDEIVRYADAEYSALGNRCGNGGCNHPSGQCSGSCYNCLYHIHYPGNAPQNSKTLYDCPKMLLHYVCQYSYLYAKEIIYALMEEHDFIRNYPYFHILSLGCGGCADLMAIETYCDREQIQAPISYVGIDVNPLWAPIHQEIQNYCQDHDIRFQTRYSDVFDCFQERGIIDTNVIVISYLISYLYNTNQIRQIDSLVCDIAERIIKNKGNGQPLLLIINDVNSNRRGRDYFEYFENAISRAGLSISGKKYRYFDTGNLNGFQEVGDPYPIHRNIFDIPADIQANYHACTGIQSTIQLLLEVI